MYFSFQLLFISALFFIFSNSLFKIFSFCSSILLPSTLICFTIITLNYRVDYLYLLHLVVLLGFYLVSSFETCSSIISFYLTGCFYFCVSGSFTFPDLGEVAFCRRHPIGTSSTLSDHQSYMPLGYPPCGLHGSVCCGRLTAVGGLVGVAVCQSSCYEAQPHADASSFWF